MNSDEVTYEEKDFPKEENLKPDKSTSNIYQMLDDGKKSDFTISNPNPGIKHKIYGINFCNHFYNIINLN